MVLAAGLGTRLRPLTDRIPKPLIEIGGVTLLERIVRRLIGAGVDRIVVNAHPHAAQVERAAAALARDLRVEILVSLEAERPLETGGGLLHAAPLLRRDAPFFLHNGDIVTEIDLAALHDAHRMAEPLATLAVHRRETSRVLLFDDRGLLGWENTATGRSARARPPAGPVRPLAFAGIHMVAPGLCERIKERGAFSILDPYLRLAGTGETILPHDVTGAPWLEIGTPERLQRAREILAAG